MNLPLSDRAREFWRDARWVFAAYLGSRILICGAILFSRMVMIRARWWHAGGLASVLSQWDGELWYVQIARHGYELGWQGDRPPHGFFPAYPILIRLTSFIFHDMVTAALVVSNLCLLAGACFLIALVRFEFKDPRVARATIMLFMFSPMSFFFSSTYSESTFFVLATGSILAARNRHWLLACLLGMCLSATRTPGIAIGLPLFLEHLRQTWSREAPIRSLLNPRILLLALVPLGLGLFMLYSHLAFGDAFLFTKSAKVFGREFTSPVEALLYLRHYPMFYFLLYTVSLVLNLCLLLAGLLMRVRFSYLAYSAALLFIYLSSATFEAFPRYISVEFPLYIIAGLIVTRFSWSYEPVLAGSMGALTLCVILWANGYWMT
ncbi:MAG: mannosyltransferase family protein [Chthoniobacterales bacterium]